MTRQAILRSGAPLWGVAALAALWLSAAAVLAPLSAVPWPSFPFDPAAMSTDQIIVIYGLLPRAAVAVLAGAALGLSGALMQAMLRNPIADPSTLGVSAGAQLAIVTATLFFPSWLDGGRGLVAFAGAFAAAGIVFLLGWRRGFEPVAMVIAGLLVGITAGSLSAAFTLSQGEYLMSLVAWNGGSLSQQDWSSTRALAVQLGLGAAFAALLARPLAVLGLDDTNARSLGLRLSLVRFAVAVLAVWLAAAVAAAVGLVSFIGLAAPALVRLAGARRTGALLLWSPPAGGLLLWLADGLVQWLAGTAGEMFPTGSVTALIGGPLLLVLLPRLRLSRPVAGAETVMAPSLRRPNLGLFLIGASLPVLALAALAIGRMPEGWLLLDGAQFHSLLPLRWPRLLAAASAGGLLALAGTILQRLTANPLASPEVMGISGGAGVGLAAVLTLLPAAGPLELLAGAGLCAALVLAVIVAFAARRQLPPERLLLAGIAISSLASAILNALLAVGDQRSWQVLAWLGGSAAAVGPVSASVLAGIALATILAALLCSRWLAILPLGPGVSQSLGLPMRGGRLLLIVLAAVATAAASLLVGPLSFVGLMAPHMARRAGFVRAGHHLAASALIGMALMLIGDFGAHMATFPYELPLGLFAAMIGAPYLIWLLGRR
jgi:iron complex transport system permease protein